MSVEHHRRLKELFLAAHERPVAERELFLAEACGDDRELYREIVSFLGYEASDSAAGLGLGPVELDPGTILGGRYRLAGVLGRGGMGDVYRAEDLKLGQTVALKLLPPAVRDDAKRLALLFDEVRLARRIGHANVCQVYDVGEADSVHFLSMEYIDGEDVASLLRRVGRLHQKRAGEIARELCEGLAAVHDQGILHRDLKPANVMLDGEGRVRLVDFGMAAAAGVDACGGTPAYMAPELYEGKASVQSDLYALGLVLYELFTGQPAFEATSQSELARLHREVAPRRPGELVDGLAAATERVILECLEKDPAARPASARKVAAALALEEGFPAMPRGAGVPAPHLEAETGARLRAWTPPELPELPYPMLLPYSHPALLAGRDRELGELRRRLRLPTSILGLYAASGTGKSSLLVAGLVPALRDEGVPVALVRHPREGALARRLVADLLEAKPPSACPPPVFVEHLGQAARLAGKAPVLVVDQLEDVLGPGAAEARASLGVLLAATAARRPGASGPLCRWVLAYRQQHHGRVLTWLADVLADVLADPLAAGLAVDPAWPHDLATADRFDAMKLAPLGTPPPRHRLVSPAAALEEVAAVFRDVVEKPLALYGADGVRRWRFVGDGAERLARAFAEARLARPSAPLVPELQVVLARLLAQAAPDGAVTVPEEIGELIDEALADHLRRALEAAFPAGSGQAEIRRARALLVLRELATDTGEGGEGLAAEEMARAIGRQGGLPDGERILEQLATPLTRLVVLRLFPDGLRYVLSHDRMAEAVVRMVEQEGRHGELSIDAELLALRRFVALKTALHQSRESEGTRVPRRHYRAIAAHAEALLWDDERRGWWAACRARRRADLRRSAAFAAAVVAFLLLVTWCTWSGVRWLQAPGVFEDQLVRGEPELALEALAWLMESRRVAPADVLELLRQRRSAMDVLERGLGAIPEDRRSAVVLEVVELALPWVAETPEDPVLIANLVWALDYAPARDPPHAAAAQALRDRVLAPLREKRPPPVIPDEDPDWIDIPAGTFLTGAAEVQGNEQPRHEVTVSAFRIQRHEVTRAEYRLLVPDHGGRADLPAGGITWYAAYTYAAWLGGRLPTEAEWEYAARAGCPHAYCTRDGKQATAADVAWTVRHPKKTGGATSSPVMRLEPNPWGLYDMLGNVWEWTADWMADPAGAGRDPWGPAAADSGRRVCRGGGFKSLAAWAQVTNRGGSSPSLDIEYLGCRVVLPEASGTGSRHPVR